MNITKTDVKNAGIKFKELANALGVVQSAITAWPETLPRVYQLEMISGRKEAKAIRRKILRHKNSE